MVLKNLLVIYHSPCMDGYGAACAFKDALDVTQWDSVQYLGTGYNHLAELPHNFNHPVHQSTHVVFLDICPTRATLDYILNVKNLYVCVLDHHATSKDTLWGYNRSGLFYTVADSFSGASLVKAIPPYAINNLFNFDLTEPTIVGEIGGGITNNDLFVNYINPALVKTNKLFTLLEVRDLWLKHDPKLKLQADYLAAYFKEVDQAKKDVIPVAELEAMLPHALEAGEKLITEQQLVVNAALAEATIWDETLPDGEVVVIAVGTCPNDLSSMFGATHNDSTVADSLAIGIYLDADKVAGLSLRSSGYHPYARIVAEALGGGGHDCAAGATIKNPQIKTREDVIAAVKEILYNEI